MRLVKIGLASINPTVGAVETHTVRPHRRVVLAGGNVTVGRFPTITAERIAADVEKFVRLFLQSNDRWVQSPLSLHIGNHDLKRERALRLPVTPKAEWTARTIGRSQKDVSP